jgi:hypothetical protein
MMAVLRILTMVTLAAFGTAALAAQEKGAEQRRQDVAGDAEQRRQDVAGDAEQRRQDVAGDRELKVKELTQAEVELSVKTDMAKRLGLRPGEVRIAESSARVWPDAGLGCNARRGLFEPADVPGFEIVAEAGGRRVVYHADRRGRLLRCSTPRKPIDRIQ